MTKIAKSSVKRARKVNVASVASDFTLVDYNAPEAKPARAEALQIEFHASMPVTDDKALTLVESLDYDAPEDDIDVLSQYQQALAQCFVKRVIFETNKHADNCVKVITKHAKRVVQSSHVLNVFLDSQVVPDFINRSIRANYCFNEKTCDRMIDTAELIAMNFLQDATESTSKYHYIASIFRSIARFEAANVAFTRVHAQACLSNEKCFSAETNNLISWNWKYYAKSTTGVQDSMTLNALVEMHAINERTVNGTEIYTINRESYAGEKLLSILC